MPLTDGKPKRLRLEKALALLLACIPLWAAQAQPLDEHYQAARTALARGNTDKAKRELKLSIQANPLQSQSHFLLALLLARAGELDQAMVGFQQTLALEPNNAAACYNLGTAMLWRGEALAAARLLEDALSLRPEHVPSYNNLGKAYFVAGLPELACACYQEALRREPSNPVALRNLALLAQTGGVQKGNTANRAAIPIQATKPAAAGMAEAGAATNPPDPAPVLVPIAPEDEAVAASLQALRELTRDLPHVTPEWRGGRLTLGGWTSGANERRLLDRILAGRTDILDLTSDDAGDPHRMVEVDAILFVVIGADSQSVGHNFLRRIEVNASVADGATAGWEWLYSAAINYEVNIANAIEQRLALLARPHLTTLSGTPASFIAGGDIVFKVAGTTSGDIKPYPFGTSLDVTPTLLRTAGKDGSPRVRLAVKAGRKSVLPIQSAEAEAATGATAFENISVTSEAVLAINQTLILTGLNQRERRASRTGVPGLRSIPIIKYLFSEKITTTSDLAIIILLTPRDPGFWDEQNRQALEGFVAKRKAYVQASKGTEADMRRFKERYPDWSRLAPNRFSSHFFLMENSEVYRRVSGMDLADEALEFDLLGKLPKARLNR